MSFDKLLSELGVLGAEQETMSKALPAEDGKDDEKIQAAAAEGGDMDANKEPGEGEGANGDPDASETLGKSLGTVTLEDGTQAEAVDGTELVKSLIAQVDELKTGAKATESQMVKALEQTTSLIKSQGEMIKSLTETVKKLSSEGRGRKAVLAINEKPAPGSELAKSEPSGMTGSEFFAKSEAAFAAGKISGKELTTIDVALRTKAAIDPSLIQKVVS